MALRIGDAILPAKNQMTASPRTMVPKPIPSCLTIIRCCRLSSPSASAFTSDIAVSWGMLIITIQDVSLFPISTGTVIWMFLS